MNIKPIISTLIFLLTHTFGWTQTAEDLYNQSLTELNNKNYEKGITIMNEFIEKYPDFANVDLIYINRAIAKAHIKDYEGAIKDYTTAYEKNPKSAEALRQRGFVKKERGDFKAALTDYDLALKVDSNLGSAYVNKAVVLDTLGQKEEACKNYEKALEHGVTSIAGILYKSCDSNSVVLQKYMYKILIDKTTDKTYGYTKDNPIKVGHGPKGQRAYLEMLRDGQGNKVEYERKGNAGYYPSKNGLFGMAAVDSYNIKFKSAKGKKKTVILYLSFYDYDPPKIPLDFYSTEDFKNKNGD